MGDPEGLGIVKDPRVASNSVSSCWLHKRMEAEYKREDKKEGPCVFYPKKNQAILTSLSEHIAQIIKKQSGSAGGGDDDQIVTYEDLRDPKVAEAMKYTLGVIAGDDCDKKSSDEEPSEDDDPKDWSGKNVFQLLSANIVDLLDKKKTGSTDGTPDNAPDSTPEETTQEDCNRGVQDQENQTPTTTQS